MKRYIIALGLGALLGVSACSKDSFDVENNNKMTRTHLQELNKDPKVLVRLSSAALSAAYLRVQSYRPATDNTNFGLMGIHHHMDMQGEDIAIVKNGHFYHDYAHKYSGASQVRASYSWYQMYKWISDCNIILRDYFEEEQTDEEVLSIKGQVLGIRGMAYFYLINEFQTTYVGSEDKPGVPLVLDTSGTLLPRATVREVYEQIIRDLTFAYEHAKPTKDSAQDMDQYVAAAYLAKVYASMEDWENTAKYAAVAKQAGTDIVTEPYRSWELGSSPDVIWGAEVTANTTTSYASFYSMADIYQTGYASYYDQVRCIYIPLYTKIPTTDSRKKLWIHYTQNYDMYLKVWQDKSAAKTYVTMRNGIQLKYANTEQAFRGDYSYMRVQDPILLEIEALNELGKTAEAATALQTFVRKRDTAFTAATTQDELREQIRFQRRIELWMEGTSWLDLRRWKATIDRTATGSNHYTKLTAREANSYVLKIPQYELDNNPLLVQNE